LLPHGTLETLVTFPAPRSLKPRGHRNPLEPATLNFSATPLPPSAPPVVFGSRHARRMRGRGALSRVCATLDERAAPALDPPPHASAHKTRITQTQEVQMPEGGSGGKIQRAPRR
jgi:hypothetical protein